jgi:hypothetical protein
MAAAVAQRFPIRRSLIWRPLLILFGGSRARSFVAIEDRALHLRFGWLFDETVPIAEVVEAVPAPWPLLGGIGWRTDLAGRVGLIGSTEGVVRLRLSPRRPVRVPFRAPCELLFVSLEQPLVFLEALAQAGGQPRGRG